MNKKGFRVGLVMLLVLAAMMGTAYAAQDSATGSIDTDAGSIAPLSQGEASIPLALTVVNFDDIALPPDTYQQIYNYAGITWDSGLPDYWGTVRGGWAAYNSLSYATPKSPPNYVFNVYGAINPGFTFVSKVKFNGAYFGKTSVTAPSAVRFVGYVSGVPTYYSAWLTLPEPGSSMAYLAADFPGVDRVVVEMNGMGWFAMDDVSYDPISGPVPDVTISTDKTLYKPGEIVNLKVGVSNPTTTTYKSNIALAITWPDGTSMTYINTAFTMPPGFNVVKVLPNPIPNSIFVPNGKYTFTATLTYDGSSVSKSTTITIQR